MGLGAGAKPGIVVLTAKELDGVVALVKVEVEVAAALRAFQQAAKDTRLLGDGRPPTAGPLVHTLDFLPGGSVHNGLVDIQEDGPVFLRVFNAAFHLERFGVGLEVDNVTTILLAGENGLDRGVAPLGWLYGAFGAAPIDTPAVIVPWLALSQ